MQSSDPLFGAMSQALKVHGQRMQLLAGNIANADTPGYKARDIDFRQILLAQTQSPVRLRQTDSGQSIADRWASEQVTAQWRVPVQPSADGNTVETPIEQAASLDASLRYQAALRFIDGKMQSLRAALKVG